MTICAFAGIGSVSAQSRPHFVIDPGHGGKDPGSQVEGVDEKDLTLDLALRIHTVLTGRGFSTTLTRTRDEFVSLEDRVLVTHRIPGSVFLSVHFNAHEDRTVSGIETFYWPGNVEGQRLAKYIQGELGRRIVTKDRGFKPEEFGVLKTPSIAALVECGFISNRWECQRCQSAWFKQVLAEEIAQALIRYSSSTKLARLSPPLFSSEGNTRSAIISLTGEQPNASANSPILATPFFNSSPSLSE